MAEQYARNASRVALAQIVDDEGFGKVQESALDTLTDIMVKCLRSHAYCEMATRTETNVHDVIASLKDQRVTLDELCLFAQIPDIPTARPILEFPNKRPVENNSNAPIQNDNMDTTNDEKTNSHNGREHIPSFLPPFPETRTWKQTPVFEEHLRDQKAIRKAKSKDRKVMEESLAKLNEELGDKPIVNYDTARKISEDSDSFHPKFQLESSQDLESANAETEPPTPLHRDSLFMVRIQKKKKFESTNESSGAGMEDKRVYSELEESERKRKRERAEQLLDARNRGQGNGMDV
ncbi:hypothetical protein PROFUN_11801 [Planoprotostelium fungivorum]|uniref:Transcription initiation factor TFIID subunit 8 n=1 Tax=Planoprotostelium fungivorum TaxID=1890364 RepID=A0A2P6MRG6_9EUKA|nr:hypothetical protein PROFUN_11801 [Planoprotostelium fungivorum]